MSEPNLEQVVVMLGNGDYSGEVFRMPNSNERIAWLLYYLMEENKETLYRCIMQQTQQVKREIFKSLVRLYPLSRDIILLFFYKSAGDLDDFIDMYDPQEQMLGELQRTVSEIAGSTQKNSRSLKEYRQKIEEIKQQIAVNEDILREKKEARKEYRDLDHRFEELNDEIAKVSVTREELLNAVKEKEEELHAAQEQNQKREQQIERMEQELKKIQETSMELAGHMPEKYENILNAVQKAMKALA